MDALVRVNTLIFCVNILNFAIRIGINLSNSVSNFHSVIIFRCHTLGHKEHCREKNAAENQV